jgi:hypothetical protein
MQLFPGLSIVRAAAETAQSVAGLLDVRCSKPIRLAAPRCRTMDAGFFRIELSGPASAGGFSGRPDKSAIHSLRAGLVWLPVAVVAGFGAWMLLSGYASKRAESEPARPVPVVATEPAPAATAAPTASVAVSDPPSVTGEAIVPEEATPIDRLKISSQSWRRGGLGSKALITFTLRNSNDYAVKDIEIACAFSRRDGSHLTDRSRMIHDIVNMKSRKTFAGIHVGFVNINASKARCALVAASHI